MADFELIHRPAVGTTPAPSSDAFTMKALPEGTLIQILGKPGGDLLPEGFKCQPKLFERSGADPLLSGAHRWAVGEDQDHYILPRDASRCVPHQEVN